VVDFLYPGKSDAIDKPTIPELTLPINVGIAFVPSSAGRYSKKPWKISEEFKACKFTFEVVPSTHIIGAAVAAVLFFCSRHSSRGTSD